MVLLDTDLLIAYWRGERDAIRKLEQLVEERIAFFISPVTVSELFEGAQKSSKPGAVSDTDSLLSQFPVLDFDFQAGRLSGQAIADLEKRGEKVEDVDVFIACTAISRGHALITRNLKHFSRFKGLKVETW